MQGKSAIKWMPSPPPSPGMHCKIDMKTGKATVTLKQGAQVKDQVLRQAMKKAGFSARKITRP